MNKKAIILIIVAVMLISTFSIALVNSGKSKGGTTAPVRVATPFAYSGDVTIYPNGTVSVAGVLSSSGNTYTLLQNMSGTLADLRNGSSIDGAGYTITAPGNTALLFQDVSNVSVSNLVINTAQTGLYFLNSNNGTASNLEIQSTYLGLVVYFSSHFSLTGSTLNSSYYGVYVDSSLYLNVVNVTATNMFDYAVYMYSVDNALVRSVYATSSYTYSDGLVIEYCSNVILSENDFSGFYDGLYLYYSTGIQSSSNTAPLTRNAACYLEYTSGYSSTSDNFSGSGGYAIDAYQAFNASWQNDNMSGAAYGSHVYSGQNVMLTHDSFSNVTNNNRDALYLYGVNDANVSYDLFNESYNQYVTPVYLEGVTNISLSYDLIYNPTTFGYDGIVLQDVNGFSMSNTYVRAGYAVYDAYTTLSTTFNHDTIVSSYQYGAGLYFTGGINSNIAITNSSFLTTLGAGNYVYGIDIESYISDNITISNNVFSGMGYGAYLDPSSGTSASITNNSMFNISEYGISVGYLSHVTVSGNSISNVSSEGIYVFNLQYVSIMWNSVSWNASKSTYGIDVENTAVLAMVYNNAMSTTNQSSSASANGEGIYVYEDTGQTIVTGNTITGWTGYGIDVEYSTLMSVAGNSVTNVYYGIYSYENTGFQYYNNYISGTTEAFYSDYDSNGTVFANTFLNASRYMLDLSDAVSILFYHNNFLNGSSIPTYFSSNTFLVWNLSTPVGGNYWSNYTGSGPNGFGTTPYTVNGTNIDYLPLTSMWSSPTLTFVETGLPAGTPWSATLGGSTMSSTSATIVFQPDNLLPANQSYGIGSVSGYVANVTGGTLLLTGSSQVVMVAFTPYTYAVTFTETGLQSGTSWSVTFNGTTKSSTSATITFSMPNGSYSYTINTVSDYTGGGTSGIATVSSAGTSIQATYSQIVYTLTVVEAGLPSGSSWSVTVNGATHTASTSTISIPLPAGTYNITVTGPSGYKVTLQTSSVTVSGGSSALSVQFSKPGLSSTILGEGIAIGVVVGIIVGVIAGMFIVPRFRKGKQQ